MPRKMNDQEHRKYWDTRIPKGAHEASYDDTDKETFRAFDTGIEALRVHWEGHTPPGNTFRMAELGVGWGRMLRYMKKACPSAEIHGFEISPKVVKICQGLEDLQFAHVHEADCILDVYRERFDVIWTCTVLQHLVPQEMFEKACTSIVASLKPGGHVMMFECEILSNSKHMRGTPRQDYLNKFPGFDWVVQSSHIMRWNEPCFFVTGRKP